MEAGVEVTVKPFAEVEGLESELPALLNDVSDVAAGVVVSVTVAGTDAGVELGVPAVATGTLF